MRSVYPCKLITTNNIPKCPDKYNFKFKGQQLEFSLEFEPIPKSTTKIDLIEDESAIAFNFFGITLNNVSSINSNSKYHNGAKEGQNMTECDQIKYIPLSKKPTFYN
ncbi:hypothetical protein K8R14_05450, partial [bacterium]|nr:hypothetical protein [bacterium]